MTGKKIAFLPIGSNEALRAADRLEQQYGAVDPDDADIVVTLGGDGLMLETLHRFMDRQVPIYGMNLGSIGFLMNEYNENNLRQRLENAELTQIHPLHMEVVDVEGITHSALAINEVSLLRQAHQAAKLRISIDGKIRMQELIADGVMVATPAGSTAYNLSAYGPILPINTPLLALTPLSPFRPRRWRGAILPHEARVEITVLEAEKRPVSATADTREIRRAARIRVQMDKSHTALMMFDEGHNLDERILREQFSY